MPIFDIKISLLNEFFFSSFSKNTLNKVWKKLHMNQITKIANDKIILNDLVYILYLTNIQSLYLTRQERTVKYNFQFQLFDTSMPFKKVQITD